MKRRSIRQETEDSLEETDFLHDDQLKEKNQTDRQGNRLQGIFSFLCLIANRDN